MKNRLTVVVRVAIVSTLFATANLTAGNVTFGSFTQVSISDDPFIFTNNGDGTASFTASVQVDFTFGSGIPAADLLMGPLPTGPIVATLTRTGTITQAATTVGSAVTQILATSSLTIVDNANSELLLSSSGDDATLTGTLGGTTLSLSNSSPPNTLTFSSAYIDLTNALSTSRSTNFNVTDPIAIGSNGLLGSFTASGQGQFGASFAPEPGSVSLMVLGLVSLGFGMLRARRRA